MTRPATATPPAPAPRAELARGMMLGGFFILVFSAGLARRGVEPFDTWFYSFAWWSYILIVDGWVYRHRGESLLITHPKRFILLALMSVPLWFCFEILNFRLGNWSYVDLPANLALRWLGYAAAFSTVVPAIMETADAVDSAGFLKGVSAAPLRRGPAWVFMSAGAAMLALPMLWPRVFFPLVWPAVLFLLDPLNEKSAEPSILSDWRAGNLRRLVVLMSAGFFCGILWELWNALGGAQWIYTVPRLEDWKIFQMPILGYLGFLPFAASVYAAAVAGVALWERSKTGARAALAVLGLALSAAAALGVDRFTLRP